MANTYVAIATVTVGSGGAANIEFTNIPQTYTDLILLASTRSAASYVDQDLQLNGTTTNRSYTYMMSRGNSYESGSGSGSIPLVGLVPSGDTANTFGNLYVYIPNYTSSNNKTIHVDSVTENNGTVAYIFAGAGLWSNSAAITSVKIAPTADNYAQYSTATLYGIKNS